MPDSMFVFYARLPDKEVSFDLKNPSMQQVADAAFACLEATRETAFAYSPIQFDKIKAAAGGKQIKSSDLPAFISSQSSSQVESKLASLFTEVPAPDLTVNPLAKAPKGSVSEIAFSAYLSAVFDSAFASEKIAWTKAGKDKREVRIVANAGGWQSVKKVDFEGAENKEVVAACATIFERARAKLPDLLLGSKAGDYATIADAFLSKYPERKSYARLPEILAAAEKELPKIKTLAGASTVLESRLIKLFYYSCFERAGFTPFVNSDQVGRIWPELKIPKPKGNFGGKKKKV